MSSTSETPVLGTVRKVDLEFEALSRLSKTLSQINNKNRFSFKLYEWHFFHFVIKIFSYRGNENTIQGPECCLRTQNSGCSLKLAQGSKLKLGSSSLKFLTPPRPQVLLTGWERTTYGCWVRKLQGTDNLYINCIGLAGFGHGEVLQYRNVTSTYVFF